MATRLKGEFRSENGTLYEVQINDDTFTGTADEVKLGGDGFTLTHDGETDDIYSPIVGSSVDVTFYAETSQIENFASKILNAQEKRFTMRILKGESGAQALFWTGYVVQDLIEEADESLPKAIRLRATDGISLLSTLDYEVALPSSFSKNNKDVLIDILDQAGISDLFESTEAMLTTVQTWWAEEQSYSSADNPFLLTKFDTRIFTNWIEGNARIYTNALEVIRQMCVTFGSRFYFSNGKFRFEQIAARASEEVLEFNYLNDGTALSSATVDYSVEVNQSNAHRGGGSFRYLPAIKKLHIDLANKSAANLIGGTVTYDSSFGDEVDLGIVPSADNGRIIGTLLSRFQTYIATPTAGTAVPVYAVTIRLVPSDGSSAQYYQNTVLSSITSFSAPFWSTAAGTYKWAANSVTRQANTLTNTSHQFATAPLPKDGEVFFDVTLQGFYINGSSTAFFVGGNGYNWAVDVQSMRFENDNAPASVVGSRYTASNTSTAIGSNVQTEVGTTSIGDGAGALGSLYVYNGSAWVPSTGWRVGGLGTFKDVISLATSELLALQSKVVKRFEGTIYRGGSFASLLSFDSAFWLPMRSTFNANLDELDVEVFKIAYDRSNVTTDVPVGDIDDTAVFSIADSVGVYANIGSGTAALEQVQLTGGTPDQGVMNWNTDEDTVQLQMNGTTHFIGQDVVYNVKNQTGATIGKGVAVMAVGTLGASGRILIAPADATGETPARFFIGVTAEEIADGADGKVVEFGKVKQIDTSAYTEGDVLWLDPTNDGHFTTIEPGAPNLKIAAALVIYAAANGTIMVRANQGHSIADAHDVRISNLQDQDILKWDAGAGYWYNTPLTLGV